MKCPVCGNLSGHRVGTLPIKFQCSTCRFTWVPTFDTRLQTKLENDFLGVDDFYSANLVKTISREEFNSLKTEFVIKWTKNVLHADLDDEQAAAVAAVHGNIQVVARAGAGKTRALVNRAMFLQKHCRIPPNEILLLAFNKKAATEIEERLEKHLGPSFPNTMTFHALAYALVHPEESLLHDGPNDESQGLSRAFQDVIDDHLLNPKFQSYIRNLMMAHFREDWERLAAGGYDRNKEELLRFRRSMPKESLRGDFVKSFGEKVIANFLFEHDVPYKYERNHWWGNINYRPDFTVSTTGKNGVIIEYFGLSGDPDYDEMSEQKRKFWEARPEWKFLEFAPNDITCGGPDEFRKRLRSELEAKGVRCTPLSEEEIWERVRRRAIDRFTKAVKGFAGRCRKRCLSPDELQTKINSHTPLTEVEGMFLKVTHFLYKGYLERIRVTGGEDFDGLLQRAIKVIESGATVFERKKQGRGDLKRIRYILIDEYQDFSLLFHRLIEAIRQQNPSVELFCVGDDWQAINGFAGSDLTYYRNFQTFFTPSRRLNISTNYRSASSIVTLGNALMTGLGQPATPDKESNGRVLLCDLSTFEPSPLEKESHPGDQITPVVLRIASKSIEAGDHIALLSRRNWMPWFVHRNNPDADNGLDGFLNLVHEHFPKAERPKISISTAHKFKGLEMKTVVVLDAIARSYPLIHPDWIFCRILGDDPDKITQEERRLFYVALTRSVETLIIVTDKGTYSPFLEELMARQRITNLDWTAFPPVAAAGDKRIIVKVGNQEFKGSEPTLAIKDQLKASGFQWHSTGWPGWSKTFPSEGFKIEPLHDSIWARAASGVEVRMYDSSDKLIEKHRIDDGKWTKAWSRESR